MASHCPTCDEGPLQADESDRAQVDVGGTLLALHATCTACGRAHAYSFRIGHRSRVSDEADLFEVNPTPQPSGILDVGQWLTLYHLHVESARQQPDKTQARSLNLRAAQCLDEALKFFHEDNDLPPSSAFFSARSRRRFRSHPDRFSRQRILHLRQRLPRRAGEPNPGGT